MIVEDYVSFETAKLLKEKGFDEPCHCLWNNPHGTPYNSIDCMMTTYEDIDPEVVHHWYLCPTLQMAMKWLREIYKLEVKSTYDYDKDSWWGNIYPMFEETNENSNVYQKALRFDYQGKSYEESCEAAIKYCLENLI